MNEKQSLDSKGFSLVEKAIAGPNNDFRGDLSSAKIIHGGVVRAERRGLTQPVGFKTGFLVEMTPELSLAKVCGIEPREEKGHGRGIPSRRKSMKKDKEEGEK